MVDSIRFWRGQILFGGKAGGPYQTNNIAFDDRCCCEEPTPPGCRLFANYPNSAEFQMGMPIGSYNDVNLLCPSCSSILGPTYVLDCWMFEYLVQDYCGGQWYFYKGVDAYGSGSYPINHTCGGTVTNVTLNLWCELHRICPPDALLACIPQDEWPLHWSYLRYADWRATLEWSGDDWGGCTMDPTVAFCRIPDDQMFVNAGLPATLPQSWCVNLDADQWSCCAGGVSSLIRL